MMGYGIYRQVIQVSSLLAALVLAPALSNAQGVDTEPKTQPVAIETTMGTITAAIETERAPITSKNFLRYVDEHRFDGIVFYRAMRLDWGDQPNGLVQAGTQYDPKRVLKPIAHEPTNITDVKHLRGTLSMARFAPGSATGDFSILLQDQPSMDADPTSDDPETRAGFAAFGHVVAGMDIVEAIHAAPTDPNKGEGWMKGQMLAKPVKIIRMKRVAAVPDAGE